MNANLTAVMLSAILIASISMTPAFGQFPDPIMVTTDKPSYSEGDTIVVSGAVRDLLPGVPVALTVVAPNGNLVAIDQITIGENREYSAELTAGGNVMKAEGIYTISVQYGSQSRVAETTFEFSGSTDTGMDKGMGQGDGKYAVTILDEEYLLDYSITGGSIVSITPNTDDKSLVIVIDTIDDGSLTITLPRTVIDALDGDMDGVYFVMVDGQESDDVEETKTSTDRTLVIEFSAGAEEIEIIGTWIVPEFGTIAAMILAVAIISIVAISARSRLSIMPRY
ncbi:MAG: PEFG-CTERM sorting domain-containing protein [Thaumarchaeota archaeon]|nr:PEFG-CTERM sorting domain-containing protein [Nitrososphaerota archaeon]